MMLSEMLELPTAQWSAVYDEQGHLLEGCTVTGEDAVLAEFLQAWQLVEGADALGDDAPFDERMAAQSEAADYLEGIARMLRKYPVPEWQTSAYIDTEGMR